MAGVKGRSGTNRNKEKPFADALRMEIAAAGDDHKRLRRIAGALLDKAELGDIQAISQVADRLDGKPTQESMIDTVNPLIPVINVRLSSYRDMSDDELASIANLSEEEVEAIAGVKAPINPRIKENQNVSSTDPEDSKQL